MKNFQSEDVPTGGQLRMARAYLGWSVEKAKKEAGVSAMSIKRIELVNGHRNLRTRKNMPILLRDAYLKTGKVRFVGERCVCINEKMAGVSDW